MTNNDKMRNRFRAVLLGCARGDALGMPVEGWKREQILKYTSGKGITDFIEPIIVRNGAGEIISEDEYGKLKYWTKDFKKGEWTDDTILTMALAESIVAMKGLDLNDIAKRQLREYQIRKRPDGTVFGGFGPTTMKSFENINNGISPYNSGVIGGPGNGPAMKMHPIGMYMAATLDLIPGLRYAELVGKITHLDPRSVASGTIQAFAIYNLLYENPSRKEFVKSIRQFSSWNEVPVTKKYALHERGTLNERIEWISNNMDAETDEAHRYLKSNSLVFCSYPFALFMFQKFWNEPLKGLIETVNYGGDCDTTGAIYGALAGARNGTGMFPESWKKGWNDIERLYSVADGIYNLRDEEA
jgi:ADP-ribosylglycohydrolase